MSSNSAFTLLTVGYSPARGELPVLSEVITENLRTQETRVYGGHQLRRRRKVPLPAGATVVVWNAEATMAAFLQRGWPLPSQVVDIRTALLNNICGLISKPKEVSLGEVLRRIGLEAPGAADLPEAAAAEEHPDHWPSWLLPDARDALMVMEQLARLLLPDDDAMLGRMQLRGRSGAAAAHIQAAGIPLDTKAYTYLLEHRGRVVDGLIETANQRYDDIYQGGKVVPARLMRLVKQLGIEWPKLEGKRLLDLSLDAFRATARAHPEELSLLYETQATLAWLPEFALPIGADGRTRCALRFFGTKTARAIPPHYDFLFNLPRWCRGLIRPAEGQAIAYLDFKGADFGTAAGLCRDPGMLKAYASGDSYRWVADRSGDIKLDRATAKLVCNIIGNGGGEKVLADVLPGPRREAWAKAKQLITLHRELFPTFWSWQADVVRAGRYHGFVNTRVGWCMRTHLSTSTGTQAHGSNILQLATILAVEAGVQVAASVHDALLVTAPAEDIDETIEATKLAMEEASALVLDGHRLKVDVEQKVVRPDRFMDPRGAEAWNKVWASLGVAPDSL